MEILIKKPFLKQYLDVMERRYTLGYPQTSDRDELLKENKLIDSVIEADLWNDISGLYMFANSASTLFAGLVNFKNPSGSVGSASGAPTKISKIGVQGDGSTAYMVVPNVNTLAESCFFMGKEYDNIASSGFNAGVFFGSRSGAGSNIIRCLSRNNSNQFVWTIKANVANTIGGQTDSSGYNTILGGPSYSRAYKNTTNIQSIGAVSGTLESAIYLLCDYASSAPVNFSLRTIQSFVIGNESLESGIGTLQLILDAHIASL